MRDCNLDQMISHNNQKKLLKYGLDLALFFALLSGADSFYIRSVAITARKIGPELWDILFLNAGSPHHLIRACISSSLSANATCEKTEWDSFQNHSKRRIDLEAAVALIPMIAANSTVQEFGQCVAAVLELALKFNNDALTHSILRFWNNFKTNEIESESLLIEENRIQKMIENVTNPL